MKTITKYVVHCEVSQTLVSLCSSSNEADKRDGGCILGLIEALPADLEEELSNFTEKNHRDIFPINLSGYCQTDRENHEVEIYVLQSLLDEYHSSPFLDHIILVAKVLGVLSRKYRLFFYVDNEIDHFIYLSLMTRPYDDPELFYTFESEIKFAYMEFVNNEKPKFQNNDELTGKFEWR